MWLLLLLLLTYASNGKKPPRVCPLAFAALGHAKKTSLFCACVKIVSREMPNIYKDSPAIKVGVVSQLKKVWLQQQQQLQILTINGFSADKKKQAPLKSVCLLVRCEN